MYNISKDIPKLNSKPFFIHRTPSYLNRMACEVLEPISPLTVKDIEQAFQDLHQQSMEIVFRRFIYLPLRGNLISMKRTDDGMKIKLNLSHHSLVENGPGLNEFITEDQFASYCSTRLKELFPDSHTACFVENKRTGFLWTKEPWVVATLQIRHL